MVAVNECVSLVPLPDFAVEPFRLITCPPMAEDSETSSTVSPISYMVLGSGLVKLANSPEVYICINMSEPSVFLPDLSPASFLNNIEICSTVSPAGTP